MFPSRSYVFSSLASAAVSFATGAFGIWIPQYLFRAQVVQKTAVSCTYQPCSSRDRSEHTYTHALHHLTHTIKPTPYIQTQWLYVSLSCPAWYSGPSPAWLDYWEWWSALWPHGSVDRRRNVPTPWCVRSACWARLSSSASSLLWRRRALWAHMWVALLFMSWNQSIENMHWLTCNCGFNICILSWLAFYRNTVP